jgi:tyrosyl-tRNA synthetase
MDNQEKYQKLKMALDRSIVEILPSREVFENTALENTPFTIYLGADPTGPDLHIGHATNFILLEELRQLGHRIVVLFGDFTAMIGDPTGRDSTRVPLSLEEVSKNIETWKEQIGKILNFDDEENVPEIKQNGEWLSSLELPKVTELMSHVTVQQMLERDMFERRIKNGKPISLHEFLYPLLQGYDSVVLNVDAEIGGTDQTFNMLVGRNLQKKFNNKEKFVLTTTLLENPDTGEKLMSKSAGGYIALNDTPEEMFGKTMALPDSVIVPVLRHCTRIPLEDLQKIEKELEEDGNPRDAKLTLAHELVLTYHSEEEAKRAEESFVGTFQNNKFPLDAKEVRTQKGVLLRDALIENGFVPSKNEFRRLCEGGALHDMESSETIDTQEYTVEEELKLRIGKKTFVKIIVE